MLSEGFLIVVGLSLATICTVGASEDLSPDLYQLGEDVSTTPDPMNKPGDYMGPELDFNATIEYLRKYNYMNEEERNAQVTNYTQVSSAIKAFQISADLTATGEMDAETKTTMRLPRCGLKKVPAMSNRMKRYVLRGSRWRNTRLTYRFVKYSRQLSTSKIDQITKLAFKYWSDVSPLRFFKLSPGRRADIDIIFGARAHGDASPFDGRGSTLAHAYFPGQGQISGDAHFDEDELWTDATYRGTNLLQVAIHEFGHSLGLKHSRNQRAIMAPFYRGYQRNVKLHTDDIAGIRAIYGNGGPPPTTPTPSAPGCEAGFDAIASARARNRRSYTVAFKGQNYYTLGARSGIRIKATFRQTQSVDAAYARPDRIYNAIIIFLFTGARVTFYRVTLHSANRQTVSYLGRRSLSQVVRGLSVSSIDGFFKWTGNGQFYVFSGDKYYRLRRGSVAPGYPRSISNWRLPNSVRKIDAVFSYVNGRTYFFVGSNYYRLRYRQVRVDSGYPRRIGRWWAACSPGGRLEAPPPAPTDVEARSGAVDFDDFDTVLVNKPTGGATTAGSPPALLAFSTAVVLLVLRKWA